VAQAPGLPWRDAATVPRHRAGNNRDHVAAAAGRNGRSGLGGGGDGMTHILVVEDEPRLRKDLADFLVLSGFAVTGVATAQEMRAAFADCAVPAVVVLDVGLP